MKNNSFFLNTVSRLSSYEIPLHGDCFYARAFIHNPDGCFIAVLHLRDRKLKGLHNVPLGCQYIGCIKEPLDKFLFEFFFKTPSYLELKCFIVYWTETCLKSRYSYMLSHEDNSLFNCFSVMNINIVRRHVSLRLWFWLFNLYSANHRPGYLSNLSSDWPSTVRAYAELDRKRALVDKQ